MGITFNGLGGAEMASSFLRKEVVPLIERQKDGRLSMTRLTEAVGLKELPVKGVPELLQKLKLRDDVLITKGKDFVNQGLPIDIILEVEDAPDERFELERIVSGRLTLSADRVLGLMDVEGFDLGNSAVKWIKFVPKRGIYIKRSFTGNDYFIDWNFKPAHDKYHLGIEDVVERIVGS